MLAPLFVALLTSTASTMVAVYFIAAWNVASLVIEYVCILMVYNSSPILSVPKPILREENQALGYLGNSRWQDLKYCVTNPLILGKMIYVAQAKHYDSHSPIALLLSKSQLRDALLDGT
jgi:Ferroportin1 (FPN1)